MINLPIDKIYNSYLIETNNTANCILAIKSFAIKLGFDEKLLETNNHPDFRIINEEGISYKVDMIREKILDDIEISPYLSKFKIYILCNCDKLNSDSKNTNQNILLKTLEDTPKNVMFFLLINNQNKLIETVRSRCIKFHDKNYDYDDYNYEEIIDAIKMLCNYKYNSYVDILNFYEQYDKSFVEKIVSFYIIFLRDCLVYKMTYDESLIVLNHVKNYIIDFSSNNKNNIINFFLDGFINIDSEKNINTDKNLLISNLLYGVNLKKF